MNTILDTGCRINELLSVSAADFDLDNLLLTVEDQSLSFRRSIAISIVHRVLAE